MSVLFHFEVNFRFQPLGTTTSSFGGVDSSDRSECHAACHELPKTADLADRTSEAQGQISVKHSEPDVAN